MDRIIFIFLATISLLVPSLTLADESRWWDVCNPIDGKFGGGHVPDAANDAEAKVLKQLKFEKWKKYEDEFISFEYPEHDLIKLKVNMATKPFKVEGGVCTTVDNSYKQAYFLRVGEATFGVFLLTPAKWLDDGICLCGPMVHHAYKLEQGTLTRFSMLPGGAVKKAQVIGGGMRFMAFEWTHLACQKPVYERMVASMRLKTREPGGNKTLRDQLIKHYGDDGKLGLIHRGASATSLINTFGEPNKKTDEGIWSWSWKGAEYPTSLVAKIKDGRLVNLPENGISRDWDNPYPGSLPWCEKLVERIPRAKSDHDDDEEEKPAPPTDDEKRLFLESIGKILKHEKPDSKTMNWLEALHIASDSTKSGLTDPSWTKLVIDKGSGTWIETDFIKTTAPAEARSWATKHLIKQLRNAPDKSELNDDDLDSLTEVFDEKSAEAWIELANQLWEAPKSEIKRLAFQNISLQDALTVEKRIFEALAKGVKDDQGELVYYAMKTIPETAIQQKANLATALRKISPGRENSEWHETHTKALKYLSPDSKETSNKESNN
ncbi:hypothetical protein NT6N_28970 [Oceaniferula spumae]|uniref:HEAT repeat domain-containing protein n=1 Tax=Oceaniferula spumae TaxID=2979115 RepID=A0AAT9FPF1_9BACT